MKKFLVTVTMLFALPLAAQQKEVKFKQLQIRVYKSHFTQWKNTSGYRALAETADTRYSLECTNLYRDADGKPIPCQGLAPGLHDMKLYEDDEAIVDKKFLYSVEQQEDITSETDFQKKIRRDFWW